MQNLITSPYPWQQSQWDYLQQRRQNKHLPHALLLAGPKGLGKPDFALLFAKTMLCENNTSNGYPCAKCHACSMFQAESHPDVYLVQPEEPGKAIKIDQVRELIKQLLQTSLKNSYKIIILQPAEAMNVAAANSLLKILEEPPANTLFLLISDELNRLSATIRSRCQLVRFTPPTQEQAKQWLAPHIAAGQSIELLLSLAEQAPLEALAQIREAKLQQREELFSCLQSLSEGKADPVQTASKWVKINQQEILAVLIGIIIDCIRLSTGLSTDVLKNTDKIAFIQKITHAVPGFKLFTYLDELYEWKRQLNTGISLNQQLVVENLFCKWSEHAKIANNPAI